MIAQQIDFKEITEDILHDNESLEKLRAASDNLNISYDIVYEGVVHIATERLRFIEENKNAYVFYPNQEAVVLKALDDVCVISEGVGIKHPKEHFYDLVKDPI